jgi:hypothetical protein
MQRLRRGAGALLAPDLGGFFVGATLVSLQARADMGAWT